MEHITVANIEKEIEDLLENGACCFSNLERLNTLCESMKNLSGMHRSFTEEHAKMWMLHLNPPARWTMDQTTAVMQQLGYSHKPCEFWVVMNSLFSDYGKTMVKYNADKPEIWGALAHDWLDDADAEPDKVGRYYRDIVKH